MNNENDNFRTYFEKLSGNFNENNLHNHTIDFKKHISSLNELKTNINLSKESFKDKSFFDYNYIDDYYFNTVYNEEPADTANPNQGQHDEDSQPSDEQSRSYTNQEEPAVPKITYESLIRIIESLHNNPMLKTIKGYDPSEVLMIVNTIRYLRDQDPELTDKKIALRFIRKSDLAEGEASQDPERAERRKRLTQIVMTLLNNNINGKFPF